MQFKHKGLVIQLRAAEAYCFPCTYCDTQTGCQSTSDCGGTLVGECRVPSTGSLSPYLVQLEQRLADLEGLVKTNRGQTFDLEQLEEKLNTAIEGLQEQREEVQKNLAKLRDSEK